jgi:hypothetical protein
MQFEFIASGASVDEGMQEHIRQRLECHEDLNARRVHSITVRVGRDPGGSEALQWFCAVTVRLHRDGTVTSVDLGGDLRTTADRVIDEVAASLKKQAKFRWW